MPYKFSPRLTLAHPAKTFLMSEAWRKAGGKEGRTDSAAESNEDLLYISRGDNVLLPASQERKPVDKK